MIVIVYQATGLLIRESHAFKIEETPTHYKIWSKPEINTPRYYKKNEVTTIEVILES